VCGVGASLTMKVRAGVAGGCCWSSPLRLRDKQRQLFGFFAGAIGFPPRVVAPTLEFLRFLGPWKYATSLPIAILRRPLMLRKGLAGIASRERRAHLRKRGQKPVLPGPYPDRKVAPKARKTGVVAHN